MNIEISKKLSRNKDKFWYTFERARDPEKGKPLVFLPMQSLRPLLRKITIMRPS